jgi:hypothetical protein
MMIAISMSHYLMEAGGRTAAAAYHSRCFQGEQLSKPAAKRSFCRSSADPWCSSAPAVVERVRRIGSSCCVDLRDAEL